MEAVRRAAIALCAITWMSACNGSGSGIDYGDEWYDDGSYEYIASELVVEDVAITGTLRGQPLAVPAAFAPIGQRLDRSAYFTLTSADFEADPVVTVEVDLCPIEDLVGRGPAEAAELMEWVNYIVCIDGWCHTAAIDEVEVEVTPMDDDARRVRAHATWDEENDVAVELLYRMGEPLP
ncbi:MAG: hypothetical protein AB7S26_25630 [Sandaracinaceae bacterium]